MDFQNYIRAVGTGPKSNRELDPVEVVDAINQILKGEIVPERITAFLLGWRVRLETSTELAAVVEAFDKYISRVSVPDSIELGYPYDGKTDYPYLFPLYGKYLKKVGLNLVVSGDHLQPAKDGVTVKDICTNMELDDNIHYFDRETYFKELSALTDLRNILGLRTAFNTAEKLHNPANSDYAITAAFHKPYVEKYTKVFAKNYKNFLVVKGSEGTPEFFGRCKFWTNDNGEITENVIEPEEFGINYTTTYEKITLEEALDVIKNPSEEIEKLAKLNVALLLVSANKAKTIEEGFEMLS